MEDGCEKFSFWREAREVVVGKRGNVGAFLKYVYWLLDHLNVYVCSIAGCVRNESYRNLLLKKFWLRQVAYQDSFCVRCTSELEIFIWNAAIQVILLSINIVFQK